MKIGVLLSGCGVYDGAEIQEAVLTLLAIDEIGAESVCIGVDSDQHHIINHLNGEEMDGKRNMLIEAARIARGSIVDISTISPSELDALVIPGGFGSAKNFTNWAFEGANGTIDARVKLLLVNLINIGKPIAALCVSPIVIAKALEGSGIHPNLTIGTTQENSPYDIQAFTDGLESVGSTGTMKSVDSILIDPTTKIITAPCYMMDATITEVRNNIKMAIEALSTIITS